MQDTNPGLPYYLLHYIAEQDQKHASSLPEDIEKGSFGCEGVDICAAKGSAGGAGEGPGTEATAKGSAAGAMAAPF